MPAKIASACRKRFSFQCWCDQFEELRDPECSESNSGIGVLRVPIIMIVKENSGYLERGPVGGQKGHGQTCILGEAEFEVVFFECFRFFLEAYLEKASKSTVFLYARGISGKKVSQEMSASTSVRYSFSHSGRLMAFL